jgi:hypothetical protein
MKLSWMMTVSPSEVEQPPHSTSKTKSRNYKKTKTNCVAPPQDSTVKNALTKARTENYGELNLDRRSPIIDRSGVVCNGVTHRC